MEFGRLPCATHPRADELLSSWVTRLAHAHLIKAHTFGKLLFPGISLWNRDLDKLAPEVVLTVLAARTPTSLQRIRETTLRRYEGNLYRRHNSNGNTDWVLPLGVYHRSHRLCGLLFCPQCLARDGAAPYFRTRWRLALSFVCLQCGVRLQERCLQCGKPVTFFRVELGRKSALPDRPLSSCYHCGFDLAQSPVEIAPIGLYRLQVEWERIMLEGWRSDVWHPPFYFVVLRHIVMMLASCSPRCQLIRERVQQEMGVYLPTWLSAPRQERSREFEQLDMGVREALLYQAVWLLEEWPSRFITVMKASKATSTALLRDMQQIPYWYHQIVQDHFFVSNINRRFTAL